MTIDVCIAPAVTPTAGDRSGGRARTLGAIAIERAVSVLRRRPWRWSVATAIDFGPYRLLETLASGGMGVIYGAVDTAHGRPCAVKVMHARLASDAAARSRFEREAQTMALLSHRNLVRGFGSGRTPEGTPFHAMEVLEGTDLRALVQRYGPLSADRAVHLLRQVCQALETAHVHGLIHRDVKPANVFASMGDGQRDVAKLLDFGLVTHVEDSAGSTRNRIVGTPLYSSPEQIVPRRPLDARSDLYSLGCTAYYLLTGQSPFESDNLSAVIEGHVRGRPRRPSTLHPGVPADLEAIVLRCLAKRPDARYPDAVAVERALSLCKCARN